jgi:hypothetical protein
MAKSREKVLRRMLKTSPKTHKKPTDVVKRSPARDQGTKSKRKAKS